MNLNMGFGLFIFCTVFSSAVSTPIVQQQYCPVTRESDSSKVINMEEGQKVRLQFAYPNGNLVKKAESQDSVEGTTPFGGEQADTTTVSSLKHDIFCQWDFRTANESQLLLLTFDKLSAPPSKDCSNAFVAVQKNNAFESRWCGNKKQTKGKAMTLFSRGSARVSVYHNNAAESPTGFAVVVETVDASKIEGGKNALRVLVG